MHADSGNEPQFVEQLNRLGTGFHEALNEKSLSFLHDLWSKAVFPFDQWLTKFERSALHLRAHQLDTVIALLHAEMALSEGIMDSLHAYLMASPNAESKLEPLLGLHAQELNQSACEHHLIHHALPHALEIAHRTNQVIDHLGLLITHDPASRFLRTVATLMMQFHDLEQKDKRGGHSVEEATAARVSGWIATALAIPENSEMKKLIDFMASHIIVLGTTMIHSTKRTMDLSELFFDIRNLAASAGFPVIYAPPADRSGAPESKASLIYSVDAILLLIGVCDKNPASIYDVVAAQAVDESFSTLIMMNRYFERPLLLEKFFSGRAFFSPFDQGASDNISQQAFLMALIPHVSMRAEYSATQSLSFIEFIRWCRQERINHPSTASFMQAFNDECITLDMNRLLDLFFFEAIDFQINFCVSQERGLVFVANKLVSMGFSPKSMTGVASGHFQPMINPRAPVRDAGNLRALKLFYDQLDKSSQELLISELLFAIVVQAGELQACQLRLSEKKPVASMTFVNDVLVHSETPTGESLVPLNPVLLLLQHLNNPLNEFVSTSMNSQEYSSEADSLKSNL